MKNLVKNSKNDDYAIITGLKVIGLGQIMVFHRMILDARTPSFNPEFYANVQWNTIFSYIYQAYLDKKLFGSRKRMLESINDSGLNFVFIL